VSSQPHGTDRADELAQVGKGFGSTIAGLGAGFGLSILTWLVGIVAPDVLGGRAGTYAEFWPQGWGFFSTAATETATVAYRVEPGGRLDLVTRPLGDAGYRYGLDRSGYTTLLAAADLAAAVPADRWWSCPDARAVLDCLRPAAAYPLDFAGTPDRLCGLVVLAVRAEIAGPIDRMTVADIRCPP
jgi:hypothetical protein